MFGFPGTWKIYLAVEPVDMRKQYDGLWAQAEQHLGENPRQGALFVFIYTSLIAMRQRGLTIKIKR